jgi:hypothetical protein
MEIISAFHKHP